MGLKAAFLIWGWDGRLIGRIVPGQKDIDRAAYEFRYGYPLMLSTCPKPL
jgi:hypothetical protein